VTEGGVAFYESGSWTYYDVSHGLVGPVIRSLAIDSQDNVWVTTSTGVTKIGGLVGVEEMAQNELSIMPNPANGQVQINTDANHLAVYDMAGREVFNKDLNNPSYQMDVSGWTTGMYLVRTGNTTQKLIVH